MPNPSLENAARALARRATRWAAYVVMPKFTVGSIVVARHERDVLLIRKRSSPVQWGFPAGYLFYGETPARTAARELREETGVAATVTDADVVAVYRQPWTAHFDHVFLVHAQGPLRIGDTTEISEARWWPVTQLPPLAREARLALDTVPELLTRPIPRTAPAS